MWACNYGLPFAPWKQQPAAAAAPSNPPQWRVVSGDPPGCWWRPRAIATPPPSGGNPPNWRVNAGDPPGCWWRPRTIAAPASSGGNTPQWRVNAGDLPGCWWRPRAGVNQRDFTASGSITAAFQSPPATGAFTCTGSITGAFRANFTFLNVGKISASFTGFSPITSEGFTAAGNIFAAFLNGETAGWTAIGNLTAEFLPRIGQGAGCVVAGPPPVKPPNAAH